MADLSKAAHKTFSFEDDLCKFLKSGLVEDVISINTVGTGYVLFYTRVEVKPVTVKEKTNSKKGLNNG